MELQRLFAGHPLPQWERPSGEVVPSVWNDLSPALFRMQCNKACDDDGFVAEVSRCAPSDFLSCLVALINHARSTGKVPEAWRFTAFSMLPKHSGASTAGDFRPIACLWVLYEVVATMVLARVEQRLAGSQPPEQAGFRKSFATEVRLFVVTALLEKAVEWQQDLWAVSLDLSKAFDRVRWQALWAALREQGLAEHEIWACTMAKEVMCELAMTLASRSLS
jgi:hypothetical protein